MHHSVDRVRCDPHGLDRARAAPPERGARPRLNRLSRIDRVTGEPIHGYEHERPEPMLHIKAGAQVPAEAKGSAQPVAVVPVLVAPESSSSAN
jgi:hypothetical protein